MISRKKIRKIIEGKCLFCGIEDTALLDVHRIVPGSAGGKYFEANEVICCANCHRRIHDDQIQVLGKNFCSNGRWLVHCIIDGQEQYL